MVTLSVLRAVRQRPLTSISLTGLTTSVAYATWLERSNEQRSCCSSAGDGDASTATSTATAYSAPQLPRQYNRDAIHEYWSGRPVSVVYRVGEIATELSPLFFAYLRDFYLKSHNENDNDTDDDNETSIHALQHAHARNLKESLTRLGPAFIKMGQQLSIRPDLVPPAVLKELQKLCDSVEPVPDKVAMQVLREELNMSDDDQELAATFDGIHRVASASLGQVYKATLRETGEKVAIKVQRPDMERKLSLDLFLLQQYGNFMDAACKVLTEQIPYHGNFISGFAQGSYMELDYENEARNQLLFKEELKKRNVPVMVPDVHQAYVSRRVITTQWIDGTKLVDAPRHQIRKLIPVGVELFLTQMLDIGVFHADPHPANLYVTKGSGDGKDGTGGQLCLLDFGLVAEVDEQARVAMTGAIVNLLAGDFDALIAKDAKQLGFLPHDLDVTELKPILTKILTQGLLESGSNLHARKRKLMDISNELNQVFFQYPFSVPPFFALITRGLGLLEGIALSGDPDFDIFQASYPYARRRALETFGYQDLLRMQSLRRKSTTTVQG